MHPDDDAPIPPPHHTPSRRLVAVGVVVVFAAGALVAWGIAAATHKASPRPVASVAAATSSSAAPTPTVTVTASPTPTESRPPESVITAAYLNLIRPRFTGVADTELLTLGHALCGAFTNGQTWTQVVSLATGNGMTPGNAGYLIGASVIAFCPEFTPLVPTS